MAWIHKAFPVNFEIMCYKVKQDLFLNVPYSTFFWGGVGYPAPTVALIQTGMVCFMFGLLYK